MDKTLENLENLENLQNSTDSLKSLSNTSSSNLKDNPSVPFVDLTPNTTIEDDSGYLVRNQCMNDYETNPAEDLLDKYYETTNKLIISTRRHSYIWLIIYWSISIFMGFCILFSGILSVVSSSYGSCPPLWLDITAGVFSFLAITLKAFLIAIRPLERVNIYKEKLSKAANIHDSLFHLRQKKYPASKLLHKLEKYRHQLNGFDRDLYNRLPPLHLQKSSTTSLV